MPPGRKTVRAGAGRNNNTYQRGFSQGPLSGLRSQKSLYITMTSLRRNIVLIVDDPVVLFYIPKRVIHIVYISEWRYFVIVKR